MKLNILCFGLPLFLLFSCNSTIDINKEKGRILKLHEKQKDFHINKNADSLVGQFSDDFYSINKGVISKPSKEESISMFSNYFNSVDFIKWDDKVPPIINVSSDGQMAYVIVDKLVVLSYKSQSKIVTDSTNFSWVSIYKKYNNQWKHDCIISTNK